MVVQRVLFTIDKNAFTDFANMANLIDKKFTITDLDLIFTASNICEDKTNPLNPPNALVRYQFIEAIIRIGV